MRQSCFLLIAVLYSAFSFAQKEGSSKMYGYKQKVMSGMVRVDNKGREVPRKPQYNYFIYLESTGIVTPVEIWINGECYSPLVNNISITPVRYTTQTSGNTEVLVPKTSRKVLQLSTLNKIQNPSVKGKLLSSKNELVIIYKDKGRLYYKTVSKMSELEPAAMQ